MLEELRTVESYLTNVDKGKRLELRKNNDMFCQFVIDSIQEIQTYMRRFGVAFDCLYTALNTSETQADVLSSLLQSSDFYRTLNPAILARTQGEIRELIKEWVELLRASDPAALWEDIELLQKIRQKMGNKAKQKVFRWISQFAEKHLQPYTKLPFYELFFFRDAGSLVCAFQPSPLSSVITALQEPKRFLRCRCCPESGLSHTSPDLCLMASFYFEASHKILHTETWFKDFAQKCAQRGESTSLLRHRFRLALAELKIIGFIIPDSKREDVVLKIIPQRVLQRHFLVRNTRG